MGAMAFFRLKRYRAALLEQQERIDALEALLSGRLKAPALPAASAILAPTAAPAVAPTVIAPVAPPVVAPPVVAPPPEAVAPELIASFTPRSAPLKAPPPPMVHAPREEQPPEAAPEPERAPEPAPEPVVVPAVEAFVAAPLEGFRRVREPTEYVPAAFVAPAVEPEPVAQAIVEPELALTETPPPVVAEPMIEEPVVAELAIDEQVIAAPVPDDPVIAEPVVSESVRDEPLEAAAPEPAVEPVREQPVAAVADPVPAPANEEAGVAPASLPESANDDTPVPVAARALSQEAIALWAGGAAIAVGVIAALFVGYRNGYFNEISQLLLGYLMAGAMIAGAEALRRRNMQDPPTDWQSRHTPKILAAAGAACAWSMSYVGLTRLTLPLDVAMQLSRLSMLSPGEALGLMGAAALGALALSLWHGRLLGWLGLAMGFAAPALVDAVTAAAPAFFAYLFAIAAAAFALARHRDWQALAAAATVLALGWGAAWSALFLLPSGMLAAAAYGVGLTALGVSYAWDHVAAPIDPAKAARLQLPWSAPAWVGAATAIGAVALLLAIAVRAEGAGGPAVNGLVIAVALLAAAAAFREGLAPAPLAAGAAALVALALWPAIGTADAARQFAGCAGALGLAASVGGWLMMGRNATPAAGAMLAALVPTTTLLVAYLRLSEVIQSPFGWGGVALVLAAFNAFALDAVSRAVGGAAKAPGATAAFAAAAAASAVMAGAFAFDNIRMAAGVALLLAPLAWLDRRLDIPALRYAGAAFAAVTVALLSPIALMRAEIDPRPIVNIIAPTFLVAILSVWFGARLFALGPSGYNGRVTILVRIALVVLVLSFGFAEIRHLANAGDMNARYASLFEMGGHTLFLLAVAAGLAWRFGEADRPLLHWTEMFAFVAATAHVAIAGLGIVAPWWGTEPAPAPGAPVFNALLIAYALPAALFALYAWLRARIEPSSLRVYIASGAAVVCGLVWLLLEVRRAFHPYAMAIGPVGGAEHACLTLALLVASALLILAAMPIGRGPGAMALRVAAAVLTATAVLKALAIDIGFLEGAARYGAYALVAAAGVGALIGYHRYVLLRPAAATDTRASDATLLPPRP